MTPDAAGWDEETPPTNGLGTDKDFVMSSKQSRSVFNLTPDESCGERAEQ